MDYIIKQLEKRINYYSSESTDSLELANYYRIQIEYILLFLMSLLWSDNYESLGPDDKETILGKIIQPTIGSIIDIIRILDVNKLVFGNKKVRKEINRYPELRNEKIGHGYVFEDGIAELCGQLKDLISVLLDNNTPISNEYDLILVRKHENNSFLGVNYKSNGMEYVGWQCSENVKEFELDNAYALDGRGNYHRLSPFLLATFEEEFYVYRDIKDRLLGKVRYNQLLKTGTISKEWAFFDWEIHNDGTRKKTANGTIINVFANNYKKYINLDIRKDVFDFVRNNKSSVSATIWGHGGVGKTATAQSVCEILISEKEKKFDYIVFASAKDRYYNYYSGAIQSIAESIDSFSSLIRVINNVCGKGDTNDEKLIIEGTDDVLIIIDDFETFSKEDQNSIANFIKRLNINYHKILITTRANIIIGNEIQTNELNEIQTARFLIEVLTSELPSLNTNRIKNQLEAPESREVIHSITSGRPLFIFQFALVLAQSGSLDSAVDRDIENSEQAIEFLYGRIHSYLSKDGKRLFVSISQLVTENDLTNLIEKLQYITGMEHDEERFNSAIQELVKLRIIQLFENDFFRVYSKEILQIMLNYFNKEGRSTKGNIVSRIKQVTRDKRLDNEHALLENANAARYSRSEEEVNSLYRQIIHRASSPNEVKAQSILNLSDYFFNNRGKKDIAIKALKEFEHMFVGEPHVARMYSSYCWATDKRDESIRILKELISRKPDFKGDRNLQIEVYGLSLTYRSIDAVQRKEDIKLKLRYDEIARSEFYAINDELKKTFNEIVADAKRLLRFIQKEEVVKLKAAARQNAFTGLYQSVNACIRIKRYSEAVEICKYGCENTKEYLYNEFIKKLDYINYLQKQRY